MSQKMHYQQAWLILMISAVLILAIGRFTNIDLMIEDFYYDKSLMLFPWKNTWFANDFMHGYVKNVIVWFGYLLISMTVLDAVFRWKRISPLLRFRLRFVSAASVSVPAVIHGVRHFFSLHCPWSIDHYGGSTPFLKLFDALPNGMVAGHCFPAGHATVGLWLAAFLIFWLPHHPKKALVVFFAGIALGFTLGWVQQMRGAHFLFHTLWSTWLASLTILTMLTLTTTYLNKKASS